MLWKETIDPICIWKKGSIDTLRAIVYWFNKLIIQSAGESKTSLLIRGESRIILGQKNRLLSIFTVTTIKRVD